MARQVSSGPSLAEAVSRARAQARRAGQLGPVSKSLDREPLAEEVRTVLAEWRASGRYDRDVASVVGEDADLEMR